MNSKYNFKKEIVSAMTIFPSLMAFGIFINIISSQEISWLFWLNIPAFIFEQLFELRFLRLSDSYILNIIFAFIFWLGISMLSNYFAKKFLKKDNGEVSKEN